MCKACAVGRMQWVRSRGGVPGAIDFMSVISCYPKPVLIFSSSIASMVETASLVDVFIHSINTFDHLFFRSCRWDLEFDFGNRPKQIKVK